MKIAIIGDAHLCYRQYGLDEREKDFYYRWNQIINDIIARKDIDMVLQLGDIFDTHIPSSIALYQYEQGVSLLLEENIEYHSITGNHTIIRKKQNFMSPDDFFNNILNVPSLDDTHMIVDNVFIAGVKYRSASNKDELLQVINNQAEAAKSHNGLRILLLHQAVDVDLVYGAELEERDLPLDIFDYIFIGHLHSKIIRQDAGCQIIYPGSIERSSTTEAKDELNRGKGYCILDTEGPELQSVVLPCKRRFIFKDIYSEDDVIDIKNNFTEDDKIWKPIVELNFISFDVEQAYDISDIIIDDCLKLNINVLNDDFVEEESEISIDDSVSSVQKMFEQSLDKQQAVFAYDLFQIFNKKAKSDENMLSAMNLADEFFENNY